MGVLFDLSIWFLVSIIAACFFSLLANRKAPKVGAEVREEMDWAGLPSPKVYDLTEDGFDEADAFDAVSIGA